MEFSYLKSVEESLIEFAEAQHFQALGNTICFDSEELNSKKIAIVGVPEYRGTFSNKKESDLYKIREKLYQLFPGNWNLDIIDLGNIQTGNTIGDTYFATSELITDLIKRQIIPIIIGGGQDLTYANYRAYDQLEQSVNIVSIDSKFDFGTLQKELTSSSYLTKIVMDKPNNLFNFSNIGYQTYLNSQEEIDLVDSLHFDAYRLGEVIHNFEVVEPVLRDADMVSFDISSIKGIEAPANFNKQPNGFTGIEACKIARYAGISDKVTSFGVYEYNEVFDIENQTSALIAQMIWYFIEGVNYRLNEYPFGIQKEFQKYLVPVENQVLNFYKSNKSERWWIEIKLPNDNNKFKRHTLIPCTHQDYLTASNRQVIPERWIKTLKRMS